MFKMLTVMFKEWRNASGDDEHLERVSGLMSLILYLLLLTNLSMCSGIKHGLSFIRQEHSR